MSYSSNQTSQVRKKRGGRKLVLLFSSKHRFEKSWRFSQPISQVALMAYLSLLLFSRNLLRDGLHLPSAHIPQSCMPPQNNNSTRLAYQESWAEPGNLGHVTWDRAHSVVFTVPPFVLTFLALKSQINSRLLLLTHRTLWLTFVRCSKVGLRKCPHGHRG